MKWAILLMLILLYFCLNKHLNAGLKVLKNPRFHLLSTVCPYFPPLPLCQWQLGVQKKRKTLLSHNNGLYIGRDVVLITQAQIVQACWPTAVAFAVCSCAAFRSRYRRREATHQSAFVAASSFYVSLVWHLKQWSIAPSPCLIINYNFFFFFFFTWRKNNLYE